jgi:hypothetical protein
MMIFYFLIVHINIIFYIGRTMLQNGKITKTENELKY